QQSFGTTTLSVTHDLEEAFAMSDRLGIMLDGRLVRHGTPADIYHRPGSLEAARFLGSVNRVPPQLYPLICPGSGNPSHGESFFRPEALRVIPDGEGPGVVANVTFAGHYIIYTVRLADHVFTVYAQGAGLTTGDRVRVEIDPAHEPCQTMEVAS
ncbi:MAG: TOBE domain-containing protein, partial [Desulfovibrionales bacterium]